MNDIRTEYESEINLVHKSIDNLKQDLINFKKNSDSTYEIEKEINYLEKCLGEQMKTQNKNLLCPTYTNNTVDLYKGIINDNLVGEYFVCLHNDMQIIGKVSFKPSNIFGNNLSYFIEEEYRNKGLGFQAISALIEYLSENNISNVDIFIEKKNNVSIKIAEKLSEIYSSKKEEGSDYISFHFDIINKKSNDNEIKKH